MVNYSSSIKSHRNLSTAQLVVGVVFVVVFASIGARMLLRSYALTPYAAAEAESGTLAGAAAKQPDPTASGGEAVRFGSSSNRIFPREYGVLGSDPSRQATDDGAGIKFHEIDVDWASWEPTQNQFSTSYGNAIKTEVQNYVKAGDTVSISIGIQQPPSWLSSLPDGTLRSQSGEVAVLSPDYEWSAAVDNAMGVYIKEVVRTLGMNVSQYRVGMGEAGEAMYPDPVTNAPSTWWTGEGFSDLPAGLSANPLPGWTPGSSSWNGQTVTSAKATTWYNWYISGLMNALVTEANDFRGAGFSGQLAFLAAGEGAEPPLYQARINALLGDTGSDYYGTMNTGTEFQHTIPEFISRVSGPLIIDQTGAGDGSGEAGQVDCQAGDKNISVSPGSSAMSTWGGTRWVHALAVQSNVPFEIESQGSNDNFATVTGLFTSCDAQVLQWAWDNNLYDGGAGGDVQLSTYKAYIAQNPL